VEVRLMYPHHPSEPPIIYVTKYHGREVGEHSVGLYADIADKIAAIGNRAPGIEAQPRRRGEQ
jgi:hypothetical protein